MTMASVPLREQIVADIRANGPMPFWRYMELALYAPGHGYYSRPEVRVGRGADYQTSPSASPLLGRTLARLLPLLRSQLGSDRLRVVDAGAGEGTLLRPLWEAAEAVAPGLLEPVLVERGRARRERARIGIGAVVELADTSELARLPAADGLIIANELFDALPVRRLRRVGSQPQEGYVSETQGRLQAVWLDCEDVGWLPRGRECCVAVGADSLLRGLLAGIRRGLVLIIDYGYPASVLWAADGPGNPLRAFERGTLVDDYVDRPGTVDLTAHIDFSVVDRHARAAGCHRVVFTDQSHLLLALGFLDEPGAAGARRLIHPEDMGGAFKCLLLAQGLEPEPLRRAIPVRDRGRLLDVEVSAAALRRGFSRSSTVSGADRSRTAGADGTSGADGSAAVAEDDLARDVTRIVAGEEGVE